MGSYRDHAVLWQECLDCVEGLTMGAQVLGGPASAFTELGASYTLMFQDRNTDKFRCADEEVESTVQVVVEHCLNPQDRWPSFLDALDLDELIVEAACDGECFPQVTVKHQRTVRAWILPGFERLRSTISFTSSFIHQKVC